MFRIALAVLFLALFPVTAQAQKIPCLDKSIMRAVLGKSGLVQIFSGVSDSGFSVSIFTAPLKSNVRRGEAFGFVLLLETKTTSCRAAGGTFFQHDLGEKI